MNKIIYLVVLICISCTPQQRLHKIITKHPELTTADTITITDTIGGFEYDTVFPFADIIKDTIYINKGYTTVKLYTYNNNKDSIGVQIRQKDIIRKVRVKGTTINIQQKPPLFRNIQYILGLTVVILLLLLLLKLKK